MSNFILPVTIESRRIVFLDLGVSQKAISSTTSPGEDTFIIDKPTMNTHPLFSINKEKFIQSLLDAQEDLPVKDLYYNVQFNANDRILDFVLSKTQPANPATTIPLTSGINLAIRNTNDQFLVEIALSPGHSTLTWDSLMVSFILDIDETGPKYSAVTKFYLAPKSKIKFAGLDFGSEASQMYYGEHTHTDTMNKLPINLFSAIKEYLGVTDNIENKNYVQYEEGGKFFKSIFFTDKKLTPGKTFALDNNIYSLVNSLDIITNSANLNTSFFNSKSQIPNLKLIHGSPKFANRMSFSFVLNGKTTEKSLYTIKDSIYASLLQNMIGAFLKNKIDSPVYLRFCVLVPNIYDIREIVQVKKIIRQIITEFDTDKHIQAVEITNLSESDASFLGCVSGEELKPGNYYIIIDCGKGTTDFSVIQSEQEDKVIFKPIYRNGLAGAGNLISFAIFQSIVSHISIMVGEDSKKHVAEFFKRSLSTETMNPFIYRLYQFIETWKKQYSSGKTKAEIEKIWDDARSGQRNMAEIFQSVPRDEEVLDILKTVTHVYDWNGYVSAAIADLVNAVCNNLKPIIEYLNQESKCAGVLLTGRAFHFLPLKDLMLDQLKNIAGMKNLVLLNEHAFNKKDNNFLKEVCMEGIFENSLRTYSDIASTPIELKKGTLEIMRRSHLKTNFFTKIVAFIKSQTDPDDERYDQESNNLKVINCDLPNMQFLASGKVMQPKRTEKIKVKEAYLIQSRSGIYLRVRDTDGQMKVIQIQETDPNITGSHENNILKSLFPGWLEPTLLEKI